ncbi:MAG TPA: hypothetical protein VFY92_12400 [Hyphomicrobiaceae bacterium]|nr:hypothetical protein [Hyphomicrobiaceae bacterium]
MPVARIVGTLPVIAAVVLTAALLTPFAAAQEAPVRVRGTIERVDGGAYHVQSREGTRLVLRLAPKASVTAIKPASRADIKAGSYIGVTGTPMANGNQKALEIHIFPEAMRGAGEGFRAWDLKPESTMTNASVDATVASTDGQVLTLKYKDGQKLILVPDGIPIVTFAPAGTGDLKPGAQIFVGAAHKLPDGTLEAARVSVGKGVAPPM